MSKLSVAARKRYASLLNSSNEEFEESAIFVKMKDNDSKKFYKKTLDVVLKTMEEEGIKPKVKLPDK